MEGMNFVGHLADRRPLLVATAGSVDDGKSTLIGRLLYDADLLADDQLDDLEGRASRAGDKLPDFAAITDGLSEEREQGITIDVAYRYVDTPGRRLVIADVPGHEQYTRNMVTGASAADAVVILTDARRGTTTQTWRHLCVSLLLGIPNVIVAVNKMDLVDHDEARFVAIVEAVKRRAAPFASARLHFVPISARNGDNVVHGSRAMPWYDGPTLIDLLQSLPSDDTAAGRAFRFAVQYVSRPRADSDRPTRGYLGRIASGAVAVGDAVSILPSGRSARIAAIERLGLPVTAAAAPQSVALYLDRELDIARGEMLASAENPPRAGVAFDALLCWLGQRPHDPAGRYLIRHGAREVPVRIAAVRGAIDVTGPARIAAPSEIAEHDLVEVGLQLQSPLAFDDYRVDRTGGAFVLVDEQTNETVAAGLIGTDILPAGI